jgi:hypothetical protein
MTEVSSDMLCSSSASLLGDSEGALEKVEAWRKKSGRGRGCSGALGVIFVLIGGRPCHHARDMADGSSWWQRGRCSRAPWTKAMGLEGAREERWGDGNAATLRHGGRCGACMHLAAAGLRR